MSVPVKETVTHTQSIIGIGGATGDVIDYADHVVIQIPPGRGGILWAVSVSLTWVQTNVANAGGVIRLENSISDWDPFYIPTPVATCHTEDGHSVKPFVFQCFKKLPGNSKVTVNFIPYNALVQHLEITLHWILTEADPDMETFVDLIHPLDADIVSAVARVPVVTSWAHNGLKDVINIPQGKGGNVTAVILQPWGDPETLDLGGGEVRMFNDAYDIEPSEFFTHMLTMVDTGSMSYVPLVIPHFVEAKETSNFYFDFLPRDDQDQTVTCGIVWERPYQKKQ